MDNRELCLRYLMGEATEQGVAALDAWIAESPANAEQFALLAAQESAISTAVGNVCAPAKPDVMIEIIDQALALRRQHEIEDEANKQLAAQQQEDARNRRFELRRRAESGVAKPARQIVIPQAVVWLGLAAVLGIAATVVSLLTPPSQPMHITPPVTMDSPRTPSHPPATTTRPVVATLVRALGERWQDSADAWQGQLGLRQGEHRLVEGLVEIELAEGTRVVLEAPVSFTLTGTNAMELTDGRLVAQVPPSGYGFTIDTPTARIVDYGTEFGVHAEAQHQTQVHVFQGEVRAQSRVKGVVVGEPITLEESEAAAVDAGGASIVRLAFQPEHFERRVVKRLDLVDIVAGGDGQGTASGQGVDYRTGEVVAHDTMARRHDTDWIIDAAVPLRRVASRTMIDSVFVIDRRRGTAVLDSMGHTFDRFPTTATGATYTDYFGYGFVQAVADGNLIMPTEDRGHIVQPFAFVGRPELDGRALVLHACGGITLDLAAVARAHDGLRPTRFSAVALNAEAINQASKQTNDAAHLDVWVLVDGTPRFEAQAVRTADGVIEIDIELLPGDRFLSLVASDAGDGIAHDWLVLARPTLEVGP